MGNSPSDSAGPGQEKASDIAAGQSQKKTRRKKSRAGVLASDITQEDLAKWFHLPAEEACAKLGVSLTVLKRVCRKFGIKRWPFRKVKSLERLIDHLNSSLPPGGPVPSPAPSLSGGSPGSHTPGSSPHASTAPAIAAMTAEQAVQQLSSLLRRQQPQQPAQRPGSGTGPGSGGGAGGTSQSQLSVLPGQQQGQEQQRRAGGHSPDAKGVPLKEPAPVARPPMQRQPSQLSQTALTGPGAQQRQQQQQEAARKEQPQPQQSRAQQQQQQQQEQEEEQGQQEEGLQRLPSRLPSTPASSLRTSAIDMLIIAAESQEEQQHPSAATYTEEELEEGEVLPADSQRQAHPPLAAEPQLQSQQQHQHQLGHEGVDTGVTPSCDTLALPHHAALVHPRPTKPVSVKHLVMAKWVQELAVRNQDKPGLGMPPAPHEGQGAGAADDLPAGLVEAGAPAQDGSCEMERLPTFGWDATLAAAGHAERRPCCASAERASHASAFSFPAQHAEHAQHEAAPAAGKAAPIGRAQSLVIQPGPRHPVKVVMRKAASTSLQQLPSGARLLREHAQHHDSRRAQRAGSCGLPTPLAAVQGPADAGAGAEAYGAVLKRRPDAADDAAAPQLQPQRPAKRPRSGEAPAQSVEPGEEAESSPTSEAAGPAPLAPAGSVQAPSAALSAPALPPLPPLAARDEPLHSLAHPLNPFWQSPATESTLHPFLPMPGFSLPGSLYASPVASALYPAGVMYSAGTLPAAPAAQPAQQVQQLLQLLVVLSQHQAAQQEATQPAQQLLRGTTGSGSLATPAGACPASMAGQTALQQQVQRGVPMPAQVAPAAATDDVRAAHVAQRAQLKELLRHIAAGRRVTDVPQELALYCLQRYARKLGFSLTQAVLDRLPVKQEEVGAHGSLGSESVSPPRAQQDPQQKQQQQDCQEAH
ncbi:hypothetical protein N2152v2_002600 [Parachlorella kessleri]|uniref:RWP-RK transcription factor n=1 Tax=Parachlorella kessleri TaxID=3074 RepID=A0A292G4Q1_PARKE|nr:RWP-RK transcription factor [Parachlorella kessleri]